MNTAGIARGTLGRAIEEIPQENSAEFSKNTKTVRKKFRELSRKEILNNFQEELR